MAPGDPQSLPAEPTDPYLLEPAELEAPPLPPSPGLWMALAWCVAYTVVVGTMNVAGLLPVLGASKAGILDLDEESTKSLGLAAGMLTAQVGGIAFALVLLYAFAGRQWRIEIDLRLPRLVHLILALLAFPGFLFIPTAIHSGFEWLFPSLTFKYQDGLTEMFAGWPLWYGILVVAVGPAIGEELFCRGFLGRGLVGNYGAAIGMLLASMCFGLLHLDPPHVAATFVMGFAFHYVYYMSKSLLLPMLLHFSNNSMGVCGPRLAALWKAEHPEPSVLTDVLGDGPKDADSWPWVVGAALLWLVIGVLFYWTRSAGTNPGNLPPRSTQPGEWA